jgi:polyhydroxyalkanoate synthase
VRQLLTIAAPWRFCGFPDASRRQLGRLWESASPTVAALDVLPMEVLQSAFWSLDPHRTVSKFEMLASLPPGSAQARSFVTMEDWANDGPPIGKAAAREMFEDFFAADLPGKGAWAVGGRLIDPAALPCPARHVLSTTDRIVPAASAPAGGERLELALGHVGMVTGSRARQALWEPLDRWLSEPAAD